MKKLLILTFAVFAFAACAKESSKQQPAPAPAAQETAAVYTLPAVNGGEAFVLKKTGADKPVLVASMAGFCGFCKKMIPYIDELAGKYKGKNVDVIIAFVDQTSDELKNLEPVKKVKNVKVYYNGSQFAQDSGVSGFPTMFLINNKTGEMQKWVGFDPSYVDVMSAEIDKALK